MTTANTALLPPLSSLYCYIRAVQNLPMLSEQQEYELATRVAEHDDREAAQSLVLAHLRYVVKIARGYLGYGLSMADLVQEGNIGLLKAVRRFTPGGKARLATFASYWIRAEIHEFVIRNWRVVKVATTKAQRKLFFRLRSLLSPEASGKSLGAAEAKRIADTLEVLPEEVIEMRQRLSAMDVSLDAPVGDGTGSSFAELYLPANSSSNPENIVEKSDDKEHLTAALQKCIATLSPRSRDIIEARWGADKKLTLRQLADKYGVSVERIRQLEKKALQRMRSELQGCKFQAKS